MNTISFLPPAKALAASCTACLLVLSGAPARADRYEDCTTVPSAGGHIDGEGRACGECRANGFAWNPTGCVKCGTVSIRVPSGERIVDARRAASRIDWAAWTGGISRVRQSDGSIKVSTSLKNWSHNLVNQICLYVDTD